MVREKRIRRILPIADVKVRKAVRSQLDEANSKSRAPQEAIALQICFQPKYWLNP
jgi:hypothetical protein